MVLLLFDWLPPVPRLIFFLQILYFISCFCFVCIVLIQRVFQWLRLLSILKYLLKVSEILFVIYRCRILSILCFSFGFPKILLLRDCIFWLYYLIFGAFVVSLFSVWCHLVSYMSFSVFCLDLFCVFINISNY